MPEIDLGKVTGERGPQGTRGSLWYTGTGVTGTAAEGTVMPSSGVDDAKVDDIYLNVSTDDIYICVLEGAADTAKWAYKGSIKGNIGPQGPAGPTGAVDENTPMTFEQAAARENINSGEAIKTIFGKVKKWFADLGAAAFCNVVNNGTTTAANTVLDGRMGKTLTDKDNNLQDQVNELNENFDIKYIKKLYQGSAYQVGTTYNLLGNQSTYDYMLIIWQFSPSGVSQDCSVISTGGNMKRYFNKMHHGTDKTLYCSDVEISFADESFTINKSGRINFKTDGTRVVENFAQTYIQAIYGIKVK